MAFTMITVTRTYKSARGFSAQGSVTFTPSLPMVNGVTTVSAPESVYLDKNGAISIILAANNDPATTPVGTSYLVQEAIAGQTVRSYSVVIPYNAFGGTIDLATLGPVVDSAPAITYVSSVNGQSGAVTVATTTDATTSAKGIARILGGTADAPTVPWSAITGAPSGTSDATTSAKGVARILGGTADAPTVPWSALTGVDADLTGLAALGDGFPSRSGGSWAARSAGQLLSDIGAQATDADLTGLAGLGDGFPSRTSGTWAARTAGQLLSDIGAQPLAGMLTRLAAAPVTITYAASITPDASQSCAFYCTATGDVTIADITNGLAGQRVNVQITASGGARVLAITGIGYSVTLPSGGIWRGEFQHDGTDFVFDG